MNNRLSGNAFLVLRAFLFLILIMAANRSFGQWEFVGSPERWRFGGLTAANDTIYLNTIGNIYYSVDTGAHWQPVQEVLPFASFNTITIVGNRMYGIVSAITSISDWYVSHDRGVSWNKIPFCEGYTQVSGRVVRGDTLVISTGDSLIVSVDGGQTIGYKYKYPDLGWGNLRNLSFIGDTLTGLYSVSGGDKILSTNDLGATWMESAILDVENLKVIGDHWWAHLEDSSRFMHYYLISMDAGFTWDTQLVFQIQDTLNSPYVEWGGNAERVIITNSNDDLVYTTTDNGANWSVVQATAIHTAVPYWLMNRLWMDRTEQGLYSRIASSTDFGETWTSSSSGIRAAPVNNIVIAEDSVIWLDDDYTLDGGQTWHAVPYGIHRYASSGNGHMVGVYFKDVYQSFDAGLTWLFVKKLNFSAEGYSPNVYYLAGNYIITYGSGHATMSSDGGNTWSPVFSTGEQLKEVGYNDGYYYAVRGWDTVISEDFRIWTDITYDLYSGHFNSYIGSMIVHDQTAIRPNRTLFRLDLDSDEWQPSPFLTNDVYVDNQYPIIEHMIAIGDVIIAASFGIGVYISYNTGLTWDSFNDGLVNLGVNYLAHDDQFLYLGMRYGGIWRRPLVDLGGYPVIQGHTFFDQNKNGLKETEEIFLPRVTVTSKTSNAFVQSKHDGSYTLYTNVAGEDTIVALSPHPLAEITTPPQIVNGSTDSVSFGVYFNGLRDLKMDMTNVMPARPGFDFTVQLSVINSIGLPADVRLVLYPDPKVDYKGANHTPSEITTDSIVWIIPNLESSRSAIVKVVFKVPGSVGLNAQLHFEAKVLPDSGDIDLSNNDASIKLFTIGAYDPNDKSVIPEGPLTPQMIADTTRLVYTIRFQNLGTYQAERVLILDTLSEALDINSLEIISASHDHTWRMREDRVLEVLFDPIFLPHESADEQGSHGFVKYAINALPDLTTEDKITNQAHIYFDFNDPISTNIIESSIQEVIVSTDETKWAGEKCQLEISPNPASEEIEINIRYEMELPAKLQVVDQAGRIVTSEIIDKYVGNKVDIRGIPAGMFSVIVLSKDRRCVGKFVKN